LTFISYLLVSRRR